MEPLSPPIGSNEQGKTPTMREFNLMMGIVIGIAVVCGLGFISLLLTYFSQNTSAFDDLKTQVIIQGSKIDLLTNEIQQQGKTTISH